MERFELENSREFKAAMELEKALNDTCFDYKKFAESIKYFHPTLQQSLFRLIREMINVQADDSRYYDVCYNNRFATLAYWIFTLVGTGGPALWHRPFPDR